MKNNQEKIAKYGFWTAVITTVGSIINKILDVFTSKMVAKPLLSAGSETFEASAAPSFYNENFFIIISVLCLIGFSYMRWIIKRRKDYNDTNINA